MSDFWLQFTHTASFATPCECVGTVEEQETFKSTDGEAPRLKIRAADGHAFWVNVVQARLLEELVKAAPEIGDMIKIVYHGEAKRAAPGMSPTKEFTVKVRRKSQPPERPDITGEVLSENVPGAEE